ncbi:MAG TPA: erythromycin esterase family protein [Thermoanaerobaculia bacterium]|nr:erythromycin esterase family protein [Thermoanaerobaculia bacterium]
MKRLSSAALVLVLVALSADAGPRRRAVAQPGTRPSESTPAGWLAANAHVLHSIDLVPDSSDLRPLRSMIGSSEMVALGDVTHGTHEFYTVKLRVVDFLVRELDFDVVAFEAPFPLVERINQYVQGGPGNARALLNEMSPITYFFWDAEEIAALVEWMREYNAHRGARRPVFVAGFDVTQPDASSNAVVTYLRSVDPVYAVEAEQQYACARESNLIIDKDCQTRAKRILDALTEREAELIAKSSRTAYDDAQHQARVVVQSRFPFGSDRDQAMAANAIWLRDRRGETGKMILWGHSAHFAQSEHAWTGRRPMGKVLEESIGGDFFTITTMTAAGTFLQWEDPTHTRNFVAKTTALPSVAPGSYESFFRLRGEPFLLIPFRKALPEWLATPKLYNAAGVNGLPGIVGSLPLQYDAAIFIDTTTPLRPIPD